MAIFRWGWSIKNLDHEVDNCITASAEPADNLKLLCGFLVIARILGTGRRAYRDKTDALTLENDILSHAITGGQDILYGAGCKGRDPRFSGGFCCPRGVLVGNGGDGNRAVTG